MGVSPLFRADDVHSGVGFGLGTGVVLHGRRLQGEHQSGGDGREADADVPAPQRERRDENDEQPDSHDRDERCDGEPASLTQPGGRATTVCDGVGVSLHHHHQTVKLGDDTGLIVLELLDAIPETVVFSVELVLMLGDEPGEVGLDLVDLVLGLSHLIGGLADILRRTGLVGSLDGLVGSLDRAGGVVRRLLGFGRTLVLGGGDVDLLTADHLGDLLAETVDSDRDATVDEVGDTLGTLLVVGAVELLGELADVFRGLAGGTGHGIPFPGISFLPSMARKE